jgi:hypothetical protein
MKDESGMYRRRWVSGKKMQQEEAEEAAAEEGNAEEDEEEAQRVQWVVESEGDAQSLSIGGWGGCWGNITVQDKEGRLVKQN